MPSESSDQPRDVAVDQLEALGLSSYAARTFVALVGLGEGTALDVSDVSDVPRTRVYDAIEELEDHGLVDVKQSTPKRFWAVSAETSTRHFEQQYTRRINRLLAALDAIEPESRTDEQRGVWTVTGRDTISERVREVVASATDEVVFMTVGKLLTEGIIEGLREASERGVSIKLATMSSGAEDDIQDRVPEAELIESLWEWSDNPAGRLLMVDRTKTLVSVLVPDDDNGSPESRDETAIWGTGDANSLVVVLRAMFGWRLDGENP